MGLVLKKELKEIFTPMTIGGIILTVAFFSVIGYVRIEAVEEAERPALGVIDGDSSPLSRIATGILNKQAEVIYFSTSVGDISEGLPEVERKGGVALLVISPDFSENIYENQPGQIHIYWIMRGTGMMDAMPLGVIDGLIRTINQEISKELVGGENPVNPDVVMNPILKSETTIFRGREIGGLPPGALAGMASSQIHISIIVMMVVMAAGGAVIASMGMEKENRTLETLLTLPVKRNSILMGKLLACAIFGFVSAVAYMVGFSYYMQAFQPLETPGINLADFGLALGPMDYLLIGLSVFAALLAGLSMCMVLGTFSKDYKSAQTLMGPLTVLAMAPMFLTIFMDFDTLPAVLKIVMFAIPFSHPMLAVRALMFDEYLLVLGGIAYIAIFTIVMIATGVWIFNSDRLLTGRVKTRKGRAEFLRGLFGRFWR